MTDKHLSTLFEDLGSNLESSRKSGLTNRHLCTLTEDLNGKIIEHFPAWSTPPGTIITFIDFETGLRTAGPVSIIAVDKHENRALLSYEMSAKKGDLVITGYHDEVSPFIERICAE